MTTRVIDDRVAYAGGSPRASTARRWAARILMGIPVLFLTFDAVGKLVVARPVAAALTELGYPVGVARGLGLVLLASVGFYLWPRTAVLGAVLLTGYLGGAIAAHVRVGSPVFTHLLFPAYVAVLLWGGLYLRDAALRRVFPLRRDA